MPQIFYISKTSIPKIEHKFLIFMLIMLFLLCYYFFTSISAKFSQIFKFVVLLITHLNYKAFQPRNSTWWQLNKFLLHTNRLLCIIMLEMRNHQVSPTVKWNRYESFPLRRILPRGCAFAWPLVFMEELWAKDLNCIM